MNRLSKSQLNLMTDDEIFELMDTIDSDFEYDTDEEAEGDNDDENDGLDILLFGKYQFIDDEIT